MESVREVFVWGTRIHGETGDGETNVLATTVGSPRRVTSLVGEEICAIALGEARTLALDRLGRVFHWGRKYGRSVDDNEKYTPKMYLWDDVAWVPTLIPWERRVEEICAGPLHCALILWGRLEVWTMGSNKYGQLGNGSKVSSSTPVQVKIPTEMEFAQVLQCSLGRHHSALLVKALSLNHDWIRIIFLDDVNSVLTWGRGSQGAHGHGSLMDVYVPKMLQLENHSSPRDVCLGRSYSCVLLGIVD